jgi:hypothetical protein
MKMLSCVEEQEICGICVGKVEKGVIFNNFVLGIETNEYLPRRCMVCGLGILRCWDPDPLILGEI